MAGSSNPEKIKPLPEDSPSVGRIGETPEEEQARQEEKYRRGAISGYTPGTVAKDEPGPNRPEPGSPVQVAAEREAVEKMLQREAPEVFNFASEAGLSKTEFIDQVRAQAEAAGGTYNKQFLSYNLIGHTKEVVKQLAENYRQPEVTETTNYNILETPEQVQSYYENLGSSMTTGQQKAYTETLLKSTPSYQFFTGLMGELKSGGGKTSVPTFSTTTRTTTKTSYPQIVEPFYNTKEGKAIYSFANTPAAALGTWLESGYGFGITSAAITGLVEGGNKQAMQNVAQMKLAYASKYYGLTSLEAGIKGASAGFAASLPFAAGIAASGAGIIGTAGKTAAAGFYGLGVVQTVKEPTPGNVALMSIPIIGVGAAKGIGAYRAMKAPFSTEISAMKIGATDLGAAGNAEVRAIIGTGKNLKLYSGRADIGFRPRLEGGTGLTDVFIREVKGGEYTGIPIRARSMFSAKDVISVEPSNKNNLLMGVSFKSVESFTKGQSVAEIISPMGGRVKYTLGEFSANVETAKTGFELYSKEKIVNIAGNFMRSTGREFYAVQGVGKTGKGYSDIFGTGEVYDIKMPSRETPIFTPAKARAMPDFSWMKPPETIKLTGAEQKIGSANIGIKSAIEPAVRNIYRESVTPKMPSFTFGGLGSSLSAGKTSIYNFVGSSSNRRNAQKQFSFTGTGSMLNNIIGSKGGQDVFGKRGYGQSPRQGQFQFNTGKPVQFNIPKNTPITTPSQKTFTFTIPQIGPPIRGIKQPKPDIPFYNIVGRRGGMFSMPKITARKSKSGKKKRGFLIYAPGADPLSFLQTELRTGRKGTTPASFKIRWGSFKQSLGMRVPTSQMLNMKAFGRSKKRRKK